MTIHMVKLCVGADSVDDLTAWQRHLMETLPAPVHHTRMAPKRAEELLDGGSLYWVIKRQICVRQRIVDIREVQSGRGPLCELVFDPQTILTEPQPKRPFQGWRYLKPDEAPADLRAGARSAKLPPQLAASLKEAMVW